MLEEERSWERVIASVGPDGPGGEVVTVGLDKKDDVEFRHKELSVHCLVFVFFFHYLVLVFFCDTTLVRPERFELQPERLELVHSSDDLTRERKREWILEKKSRSQT